MTDAPKRIYPKDLLKKYAEGERDFSGNTIMPSSADLGLRKDFIGKTLSGLILKDGRILTFSFKNCDLEGAVFDGSDVSDCSFKGANLKNVSFHGCKLKNTNFSSAVFDNTDFSKSEITLAKFDNTNTDNAKFDDCIEEKVEGIRMSSGQILAEYTQGRRDFTAVICPDAQLSGLNLRGIILRHAYLHYADFSSSDLTDADLSNAVLTSIAFVKTTLRNANLSGSNCYWCTFKNAYFENTNLRNSNLLWTDLSGTDLGGAHIEGAKLSCATMEGTNLGMNVVNIPANVMATIQHTEKGGEGTKIVSPEMSGTYGGTSVSYTGSTSYESAKGGAYGGDAADWEEIADPTKKLLHGARAWRRAGKYKGKGTYG